MSFSKTFCLLFAVFTVFSVTGCNSQKPTKTETSASKKKKISPQIGKVAWKGGYFPWNTYDKEGRATAVMNAEAEDGEILTKVGLNKKGKRETYLLLRMNRVKAKLFSKGRHSVDIEATRMSANQHDDTVIGTGGCKMRSLQEPPNTTLTADTLRWKTTGHILIAEGNVHLESLASPTETKVASGNHLEYDMDSEKVKIE